MRNDEYKETKNFIQQSELARQLWPEMREGFRQEIRNEHLGHETIEKTGAHFSSWSLDCRTCNIEVYLEEG